MLSRRTSSAIAVPTIAMAAFALATSAGGQQTPPNGGEAQSKPPAAPATMHRGDAALPPIPASAVPSDIVWGPGHEVQAGLVLAGRYGNADQHTGLYVFGVYLRNRTRHTLNVNCQSFSGISVPSDGVSYTPIVQSPSIYCSPHVWDSKGRQVEVRYDLGVGDSQYALGPGQVATVSHWMLRTKDSRAKGSGRWSNNQVAFVEPGKYRVSCDVSTSWGSKGDRRTLLRTGEAAFEVTGVDLALE
jgi:hypothetical protein